MRTTRRTKLAVILGERPGRDPSRSNPAMPKVRNRLRQRDTFLGVILIAAAICLSCWPSAANSTIRAGSNTRAGSDRLRDHCSKAARVRICITDVFAPSFLAFDREDSPWQR